MLNSLAATRLRNLKLRGERALAVNVKAPLEGRPPQAPGKQEEGEEEGSKAYGAGEEAAVGCEGGKRGQGAFKRLRGVGSGS